MRRKLILIGLLLIALTLLGSVLYVAYGDHTRTLEQWASRALGRELSIGGDLEIDFGRDVRITASEVGLANPDWSDERWMVRVGKLEGSLDLRRLLSGHVHINDVTVERARVVLAIDERGRANWTFGSGTGGGGNPDAPIMFSLQRADLDDVTLIFRDPALELPLELAIDQLTYRTDSRGMMDVDARGTFVGYDFEVAGIVGTFAELLALESLEPHLTGHVGPVSFTVAGTLEDLDELGRPDLMFRVEGPDLGHALSAIGLPRETHDPFRVDGRARPVDEGIDLSLNLGLGPIKGSLEGTLDTVLHPRRITGTVDMQGPELTELEALTLVDGFPDGPFHVTGTYVWEPERGVLRDVRVRVGEVEIRLEGGMGAPPALDGTDLAFEASGPDLSVLSELAGAELPAEAFRVQGAIEKHEQGYRLEQIRGRVGANEFRVDGQLGNRPEFLGTRVTLGLTAEDASWFAPWVGPRMPEEPLKLTGTIASAADHLVLEEVELTVGGTTLELDGRLFPVPGLVGTDVRLWAKGPDLSALQVLTGLDRIPEAPFEVRGALQIGSDGYVLDGMHVVLGGSEAIVSGRLGPLPGLGGSDLDLDIRGNSLMEVGSWISRIDLPDAPFSVSGQVTADAGSYQLHPIAATVKDHTVAASGTLVLTEGMVGTDLDLRLSGPSAEEFLSLLGLGDRIDLRGVPDSSYTVAGGIRLEADRYELRSVELRVAEGRVLIDGDLGHLPDGVGTNLWLDGNGDNGAILGELVGLELPPEPFRFAGRVGRADDGLRFEHVELRFGQYDARADGTLGHPPTFEGTRLDVHVEGPDIDLLKQFVEMPVRSVAFDVTAHLEGTPERFDLTDLSARLGNSDLAGSVSVDLTALPDIHADFTSTYLDQADLYPTRSSEDRPHEKDSEKPNGKESRSRLIPDIPLPLDWLAIYNADLRWRVDTLDTGFGAMQDLRIEGTLKDGRLVVGPLTATGRLPDETFAASLVIEPAGETHRVSLRLIAKRLRLALVRGVERAHRSAHDIDISLTGQGDSLHRILATTDGRIVVLQGPGRLDNSALNRLTADVLLQILQTLDPFVKEDPYTQLECGVYLIELDRGMTRIKPLVVNTDKMTILGEGRIDLSTEALDLKWAAKPRKGVGLSASTLTNPYIKLGGTLSNPRVEIKPLSAAVSATVAFSTGGLSLLFGGMLDRATSGPEACMRAMKEAGIEIDPELFALGDKKDDE